MPGHDPDPFATIAENRADPIPVVEDLRARLDKTVAAGAAGPPVDVTRYQSQDWPRVVDGIVVPALSVENSRTATWVLTPVGEIATIGLTVRAVGFTPRAGRWLAVWIGDDADERLQVLTVFTADVAAARARGHR